MRNREVDERLADVLRSMAELMRSLDGVDGSEADDEPLDEIRCEYNASDRLLVEDGEDDHVLFNSTDGTEVYVRAAPARRFAAAILRVCDEVES